MSDNTEIVIKGNTVDGYLAYHHDVDQKLSDKDIITKADTLEEIVDLVNKWEKDYYSDNPFGSGIEYGIRIIKTKLKDG